MRLHRPVSALVAVAAIVLLGGSSVRRNTHVASAASLHSTVGSRVARQPAGSNGGLFDSYSPVSPHWPHIRTMVTDFRTGYVANAAQRTAEVAWNAAHYDYVMSGDAATYHARNRNIHILPYALDWNVMQPRVKGSSASLASGYYDDMVAWFARHPGFRLEDAFLHVAGQPKSSVSRVAFVAWGSARWALNPGDSALRAYQVDRIRRLAEGNDGVFFDSHSSGDVWRGIGKHPLLEYPDHSRYEQDLVGLVRAIAAGIAPKTMMINTAEYMRPFDQEMILAAGAVHLERMNSPLNSGMTERWRWVDTLLTHHVLVELVPLSSWDEANSNVGVFRRWTAGDSPSKAARLTMWELASYYLLVPKEPDLLLLALQNAWKVPFSQVWLGAQETNIGHPLAARRVYLGGKDPLGNGFTVWARDFDRALVLVRPTGGWKDQRFDDSTAVTVPLPDSARWRRLLANGRLGDTVTAVRLRNAESAIVVNAAAH